MQPLKPYFSGREKPPHHRLTDAPEGASARPTSRRSARPRRHLTFFEMMGNFSIGDYFKRGRGAVRVGPVAARASGSTRDDIWVTVFEGDDAARASAPTRRRSQAWLDDRRPARADRAVQPQGELLGVRPDRPVRARARSSTSTAGWSSARPTTCPGGDNERFMEYWNLVFMQYDQEPRNTLTPLPAKNIDTGLGLERLASLLQGVPSVFETDAFRPLVGLGEELSGRRYGTRLRDRPRAADPRRPRARHELPARRRRRALQRGPRLPAAADHAPRDRAGPPARHRGPDPAAVRGAACAT